MQTRVLAAAAPVLLIALACSPAPTEPQQAEARDPRPNVVLYVVDTLRSDALRAYGHSGAKTPNADSLGYEGTVFVNSHAPSSWTRASIGSILTGLYPDVHGALDREDALTGDLELLAERFAENGYATGAVLANPNVGSFFGFSQGFDDFVELYDRREPGYVKSREATIHSDVVVGHAIDWIDRASRPFLLLVLTVDPHWPYEPPTAPEDERESNSELAERFFRTPSALDRSERERLRKLYQAEVEFDDASLGRLLDHLRAEGIYDDTIVVYTADHGEEFWEHGLTQHGKTLYEESTRVPLIIRYPPKIPMAARVEQPALLVDIAPTVLELAGIAPGVAFDGTSLSTEARADDRAVYAVLDLDGHRIRSITRYPWKLILDEATGEKKLFNLELDAQEIWNLASKHPQRAAALFEELRARIDANERRRSEIQTAGGAAPVREHEIPESARQALKALGYVE